MVIGSVVEVVSGSSYGDWVGGGGDVGWDGGREGDLVQASMG